MITKYSSFLFEASGYNNQGYSKDTIKSLQQILVNDKILPEKNKVGKSNVDGKFGEITKQYLQQYQKNKSLKDQSGKITKETLDSMGIKTGLVNQSDLSSSSSSSEIKQQGGTKPEVKAQTLQSYGKFTPGKDKASPLVVVFGGIPVGGRESGDYMYDYFNKTGDRYNLFVANSHKIDGAGAYQALKNKIGSGEMNPSKKILYLFSGGYRPGQSLLSKFDPNEFDKILLVDIWMGSSNVANFYKNLTSKYRDKVEYYYTDYGANNPSARNEISSLASKKEKVDGHMKSNVNAISSLLQIA
jgi:peptidoglycan hydrolase-like protein with peptidoglycan-binding domain